MEKATNGKEMRPGAEVFAKFQRGELVAGVKATAYGRVQLQLGGAEKSAILALEIDVQEGVMKALLRQAVKTGLENGGMKIEDIAYLHADALIELSAVASFFENMDALRK